ncbi:hypothetical protein MMC30_003612 [Trapelia coarctata]|nr:hypothetical protein [Trapelia coarctata]
MVQSDIEQSESGSRRYSSLPLASQEQSADSSGIPSRRASITDNDAKPLKERKHRVQFGDNVHIPSEREASSFGRLEGAKPMPTALIHQGHTRQGSRPTVSQVTDDASIDITEVLSQSPAKPSLGKFSLGSDDSDLEDITDDTINHTGESQEIYEKAVSQRTAHSRAQSLSRSLKGLGSQRTHSSRSSMARSPPASPLDSPTYTTNRPLDLNNIPLEKLAKKRKKFSVEDESDTEEEDPEESGMTPAQRRIRRLKATVANLVRAHNVSMDSESLFRVKAANSGNTSGHATPIDEHGDYVEYIERPSRYRTGVLGSLMRLYHRDEGAGGGLGVRSTHSSPTASGASTPAHKPPLWYKDDSNQSSTSSLTGLLHTSKHMVRPGGSPAESQQRTPLRRLRSSQVKKMRKMRPKRDEVIHISRHIEEQLARYHYLESLCKALIGYGAPTHRLEEYLSMSARVLEINARFLFIPGCMLISFEDPSTLTTDVRLVRAENCIDLGKLHDMYLTYKAVLHDRIGASEGSQILEELSRREPKFSPWVVVLFFGLASTFVGPFAFQARLIDLPMAFVLGCLLGFLKIILAARSSSYSNVFEVSAAVLTSFLARALGSINGGGLFCFSALAQSSIALILPGYTVLCSALELQSRSIVAGSVRMVYAIIYSLFLGFGITIGTSVYGSIDKNATSEVMCRDPLSGKLGFIFVPLFTFCLIIINQGKWSQMPVMLGISIVGYVVNYFSALRFASNVQVAQTLGALAIGVLGNLYSRFFHGLSAAALLPAIFVQVPSGLAASGSLISGLASANQITNGTMNGTTTVSNATQAGSGVIDINSTVFNVGYSMIQVAIGIAVGLFLSSLLIYPFGKRRSGLFSF